MSEHWSHYLQGEERSQVSSRSWVNEEISLNFDSQNREYFKNLSRRLLSRIFHNMVILPPATTIVG